MYTPTTMPQPFTRHRMLGIPQTNAGHHRLTELSQMSKAQEWMTQYRACISVCCIFLFNDAMLFKVFKTKPRCSAKWRQPRSQNVILCSNRQWNLTTKYFLFKLCNIKCTQLCSVANVTHLFNTSVYMPTLPVSRLDVSSLRLSSMVTVSRQQYRYLTSTCY